MMTWIMSLAKEHNQNLTSLLDLVNQRLDSHHSQSALELHLKSQHSDSQVAYLTKVVDLDKVSPRQDYLQTQATRSRNRINHQHSLHSLVASPNHQEVDSQHKLLDLDSKLTQDLECSEVEVVSHVQENN